MPRKIRKPDNNAIYSKLRYNDAKIVFFAHFLWRTRPITDTNLRKIGKLCRHVTKKKKSSFLRRNHITTAQKTWETGKLCTGA